MMFGKLIDTNIATLCAMCATPGYKDVLKNSAQYGGSTQICYTAYGGGIIETDVGNAEYSEDNLTDVINLRGYPMRGTAGPNGAIWIGINPKDEKVIDYNFVKGEHSFTFTGEKDVSILLCLRGEITANGKVLKDLTFASITKGKVVDITVPQNSTAIIYWLKD